MRERKVKGGCCGCPGEFDLGISKEVRRQLSVPYSRVFSGDLVIISPEASEEDYKPEVWKRDPEAKARVQRDEEF